MITVIQLICVAAFLIGWVFSGLALYHSDDPHAAAAALFAIASYYAYSLSGAAQAALPKPSPSP